VLFIEAVVEPLDETRPVDVQVALTTSK